MKKKRLKKKTLAQTKKEVRAVWRKNLEKFVEEEHYLPTSEDVLKVIRQEEAKAPKVTCGNCGYKWAPNPYLWKADSKNMEIQEYKGKTIKPLVCPKCSVINRMDAGILLDILTWWTKTKIMTDVFKEEVQKVREKYKQYVPA
jgi:hypothetical protein